MKKILAGALVLTLLSVFTTMCFATNDQPSNTPNSDTTTTDYQDGYVRDLILDDDDFDDLWMCGTFTAIGIALGISECIPQ